MVLNAGVLTNFFADKLMVLKSLALLIYPNYTMFLQPTSFSCPYAAARKDPGLDYRVARSIHRVDIEIDYDYFITVSQNLVEIFRCCKKNKARVLTFRVVALPALPASSM